MDTNNIISLQARRRPLPPVMSAEEHAVAQGLDQVDALLTQFGAVTLLAMVSAQLEERGRQALESHRLGEARAYDLAAERLGPIGAFCHGNRL